MFKKVDWLDGHSLYSGNMTYRLLVADIDGTLLNEQNTISSRDKEAIWRVRTTGIGVVLCTGRVKQACNRILHELSLDGEHIFADGAFVGMADSDKEIYTKTISKALVRQIVEYVHSFDINTIDFFSPTAHFMEERTETWLYDIRRNFFGLNPEIIDFDQPWWQEKIIKATLAIAPDNEEKKRRAEQFCIDFQEQLRFSWTGNPVYPELTFINIIDPAVSKAEALRVLASYLDLSLDEVVAIGDGRNDVSLLSGVGLAIAMGNAHPELKAIADYVTEDVSHSGLATAVEKFLL